MQQDTIDITAEPIRVVACVSPLSEQQTHTTAQAGDTVGDVWKALKFGDDIRPATFVNGIPVTAEVVLAPGDLVNIRAMPAGYPFIPNAQYKITGDVGGIFTASANGEYLIQSFEGKSPTAGQSNIIQSAVATLPVIPPGTVFYPQQTTGFGGSKDIMIAPITGVSNQSNPWGRVPRVYGQVKVYPVIAATPYSDYATTPASAVQSAAAYSRSQANNVALQQQYIALGNTAVAAAYGSAANCCLQASNCALDGDNPDAATFASAASYYAAQALDLIATNTSQAAADGASALAAYNIAVAGQAAYIATGAAATFGSAETETAIYEFGHGRLAITNILINEIAIANYASALQYQVCYGYSGDSAITLYSGENADNPINTPIPAAGGGTVTLGGVSAYSQAVMAQAPIYATTLNVIVEFPNGLYQTVTEVINGVTVTTQQANWVSVQVLCSKQAGSSGGATKTFYFTVTENNTQAFRQSFSCSVTSGLYDVYVSYANNSAPAGVVVSNMTFIDLNCNHTGPAFRQLYSTNGTAIYCARLGIQAQAGALLSGTIGNLSALCTSMLNSFSGYPSGPGPGGLSAVVSTQNPADIVFDMLTGSANYLPVPISRIDLPSFAAWYAFCNNPTAAVGAANITPITFNKIYDSETTTWVAIQEVCTIGRARMIMKNGLYSVLIDQPQSLVTQCFTPRNSWGFAFNIAYTQVPNCVNVSFLDPGSVGAWQQNIVQVFDDGYTAANFQTYQDITLTGCTSYEQAWCYGRYILAQNRLRPVTYSWYCDQEAIVCNQGDLIAVTSEIIGAGLGQGRITSVQLDGSGNVLGVTIDSQQTMISGSSYIIRIRQSDGSTIEAPVLTTPGTNITAFSLVTPLSHTLTVLPAVDNLVLFGLLPSESKLMIVTNITYQDNLTAQVTAVDYSPAIYTAETKPIPPYTTQIQQQHPAQLVVPVPVITNVQSGILQAVQNSNGSWSIQIVLSMAPTTSVVSDYEYQIRLTGGVTWSPAVVVGVGNTITINSQSCGITIIGGQTYDIQVRATDGGSNVSAWNTNTFNYFCVGETQPPPDPLPLVEDPTTGNLRLAASAYLPDFAGFRIKMNLGDNENWNQGTVIGQLVTTNTFDISPYQSGLVTFMCKTVNAAGVESVNIAYLVKGFGQTILPNVLTSYAVSPAFPGALTGCSVVGGDLEATVVPYLFWNPVGTNLFWIQNQTDLFWQPQYPLMIYAFSFTPPANISPGGTLTMTLGISSSAYTIQYQPPNTQLFWNASPIGNGSNFWSDHTGLFWPPNNPYTTWPMVGVPCSTNPYNFIITAQPSVIQTIISNLVMTVASPTITYTLSNVAISPTGTQLSVPVGTFPNAIVYVNLSLVNNPSYPNALTPVSLPPYGQAPTVQIISSLGGYTGGTVDVTLGGY